MKNICSIGFKVSSVDKKALDNYLLDTPKEWATKALAGMINKSVKTIMKDWFETYKEKQTGTVSGDIAVIIPAIIAMEEFNNYNTPILQAPMVKREEETSLEIWEGGFDVEDYEFDALAAFYESPNLMLRYFMENKIYRRRLKFVEENQAGFLQRKEAIPVKQDDFINLVCNKPAYKNRRQKELKIT